ncbi:N-acetyl-D-Glu racemase DgcA [Salinarimonas rosea]|uniref:N-acetyl-D-Glu racemase DgcA n=1 Tax=Salinarimonas rosea TaxID=552063 RepID=UPI00048DEC6E|nr:N-acetyl-D-Glu racemase DgcA [Salinarimonas rosea]
MHRSLTVAAEAFPIAGRFTISRGSRTEAVVVLATIAEGGAIGRGECVPYARYGESVESVVAQIESVRAMLEGGMGREALQDVLPAGAARNAIDCALWDLDAKRSGVPAAVTAGVDRLRPATTAYTISLDTPEAMEAAAAKASARPILKIKLGAPDGDAARIAAVRRGAPDATLIADANEGWSVETLPALVAACADAGFALVEQPLHASADEALRGIDRPVPLCADESAHDRASLPRLDGLYDLVNIKLDKTGGLTEALAMAEAAQARGMGIFVGCMLATSLAMAPAMLLAPRARFVDLDGPLLLARDREPALVFDGSLVHPPERALWG